VERGLSWRELWQIAGMSWTCFRRSRPSLVRPGPQATPARRTQVRSVSCEVPNSAVIELIAAHCVGCSSGCSCSIQACCDARPSRSSATNCSVSMALLVRPVLGSED
jgi:hypothetical protein